MTRPTRSEQVERAVRDAALAGFTFAALDTLTAELERLAVLLPAEAKSLRAAVATAAARIEEESTKLGALEVAGVDNWDGYSYAMELLNEQDGQS